MSAKNSMILCSAMALVLAAATAAFAQEGEGGEGGMGMEGTEPATPAPEPSVAASGGAIEHGKLGVGVGRTLSGASGIEVEFHLGDTLFIVGNLGFLLSSPSMGDSTNSLVFAVGGFFRLIDGGRASLYIGGRLGYAKGQAPGAMIDPPSEVEIEVPARVQFVVNSHFSLHFETGLKVVMASADGGVTTSVTDGTEIQLGAGGLFGAGGFSVYW